MNQILLFLRWQNKRRPVLVMALRLFLIGLGFYLLPVPLGLIIRQPPSDQKTILLSIFHYLTIIPALAYWALAIFAPIGEMRNRVLQNPSN
jgi:ABC-type proline/glycine betaine transport system permease subunit